MVCTQNFINFIDCPATNFRVHYFSLSVSFSLFSMQVLENTVEIYGKLWRKKKSGTDGGKLISRDVALPVAVALIEL